MKRTDDIKVYFIPVSSLCLVLHYLLRLIVTWYSAWSSFQNFFPWNVQFVIMNIFTELVFFFLHFPCCRARLWVERSGVWIPEGERDFSLPQIVHIVFGSHPASHSMDPAVTSCGVKRSGKDSRLRTSGAIMCRPLYALMSWTVTTLPSSL